MATYIDPPQLEAMINSLVEGGDYTIQTLQDILRKMNTEFTNISTTLNPVIKAVRAPLIIPKPIVPINFSYAINLTFVRLSWTPVDNSSHFEIRRGSNWDTAFFQTRTATFDIELDPMLVGTYTYLLKSMNNAGDLSDGTASTTFTIIGPNAPTLSATIIDNNVLLSWTDPHTHFSIDYYNVYRDTVFLGMSRGTFTPIFETTSGTYTYKVQAIDIAGNAGPFGTLQATVNQPPDFELEDTRASTFDGTKVNCIKDGRKPSLIAIVDTVKTWQQHYTTKSWNTPQDQINAGYPIYIQPTLTSGSYEEIVDYGLMMSNLIVNINYQIAQIVPSVSVLVKMAVSNDNITYTSFISGASQFYSQFRYLKYRLEFTGVNDASLAEITQLIITLDVKREVDSGDTVAQATDVGGTQVNFNKAFKDIDSITATADSIEPVYVIYDFLDVPNPVGFKVFALDSSGNRVTYRVSWKARGIV